MQKKKKKAFSYQCRIALTAWVCNGFCIYWFLMEQLQPFGRPRTMSANYPQIIFKRLWEGGKAAPLKVSRNSMALLCLCSSFSRAVHPVNDLAGTLWFTVLSLKKVFKSLLLGKDSFSSILFFFKHLELMIKKKQNHQLLVYCSFPGSLLTFHFLLLWLCILMCFDHVRKN